MSYEQIQQYLDRVIPNKNIPCAIRVKGLFQYLKVRSVSKQNQPYLRLSEVVKTSLSLSYAMSKALSSDFACLTTCKE